MSFFEIDGVAWTVTAVNFKASPSFYYFSADSQQLSNVFLKTVS